MTLVTGLVLLAAWIVALRWLKKITFEMLQENRGSRIMWSLILGFGYCLPLLLSPVLGLVAWNFFWVALYVVSALAFAVIFRFAIWAIGNR
jgi:hypothetical protein